ncbi:MAG: DUF1611 domain-containing protein [Phycisphaerales bacterium]|nr:MAG: DUF1611 domain-containing protein [Phycisphaerales bacterium]
MTHKKRICILTDGHLDPFDAKTAVGLLRYRPDEVVAVLDPNHAGENLEDLVGCGAGVPIVESIESASRYQPDHLLIGVAPPGGRLPADWRRFIRQGLAAGMNVINGLHDRLGDDPEFAEAAAQRGLTILDVRAVPRPASVGTAKAARTRARRVLTVGTDCNIGKRLTAMELTRALSDRGLRAEFVATGQTGVMITGSGVVVDAVISDFVSGAIEAAILEKGDADCIVVEGQGALLHPSYSAVALGLLHGTLPDRMILCHAPQRKTLRNIDIPIPPLNEVIQLYEAIVRPLHPAKVVGVALNGHGMSDAAISASIEQVRDLTGLPVVDCIRTGVGELADAVCAA